MKHKPMVFAVVLFFLATACATSSNKMTVSTEGAPPELAKNASQAKKSKVEDHVICAKEMTVGSHIPETVCRSVEQTERNRQQVQNSLDTTRGPAVMQGAGSGG